MLCSQLMLIHCKYPVNISRAIGIISDNTLLIIHDETRDFRFFVVADAVVVYSKLNVRESLLCMGKVFSQCLSASLVLDVIDLD